MDDFLSLKDVSPDLWNRLLRISSEVKKHPGHFRQMLSGKSVVLIFEKPSLRTRLTFDLGTRQLGGEAVFLGHEEAELNKREALPDVARNLERWFDCIVARTFSQEGLATLAQHATIPVINALSDSEHPCQALADLFTLTEKWDRLPGRRLAFVGDGNNVCTSLVHAAALSGMSFLAITPPEHKPAAEVEEDFQRLSTSAEATYRWTESMEGLEGVDAVYTDTWVSMGQEDEVRERMETFRAYQVTPEAMERAARDAFFMHCLPAHRNQEVTDAVIDSSCSLVFEQAENRLHVQKALLLLLLAERELARYFQLGKWAAWQA